MKVMTKLRYYALSYAPISTALFQNIYMLVICCFTSQHAKEHVESCYKRCYLWRKTAAAVTRRQCWPLPCSYPYHERVGASAGRQN
eukprot:6199622-Pleurochrysis_carterae.AAC.1